MVVVWSVLAVVALFVAWKTWSDAVGNTELAVHRAPGDDRVRARARRLQLQYTAVVSVVASVVLGLFAWFAFVEPQLDDRQQDAKEALYRAGIEDRWNTDCAWVFYDMLDTPGGVLFNTNVPYDAAWCQALLRMNEVEMPDGFGSDPYENGWLAGGGAVDAVTQRVETLCFGSQCADVKSAWYDLLDRQQPDDTLGW